MHEDYRLHFNPELAQGVYTVPRSCFDSVEQRGATPWRLETTRVRNEREDPVGYCAAC